MKKIALTALTFAPAVAFAQNLGNLETLLRSIGRLVNIALPIVVAIALLVFFWGLVKFIFSAAGEEAHKAGQQLMIWGLIALFVMVAVWGLVRFIGNAIGVTPEATPQAVPTVPGL
ncbi:MAG: hypothetical protein A3J09_00410 [Candidatus Zambryskibacteria bacterium RIFCSPLOWO2_02_FULL_51_21]|uniref:Conjugal transfer protein TrbC n=1 Tax=Candidatus Zambryskibacteria bacterium RIFCSPHIGHO2_02_FULL_43_37 TaxID=1802749 RepID=A0A1G2THZ1_9BACT|nr:MAG: hypothetical protein A2723_00410 [Candidatus Zambryskibacteria bacterium RIFCSPHIGHO2_01_FULL_52_18]OHA96915.1 MAG: hypothetical protein A3D49_02310 [Candidatus Zambryskibacteria bacterium RIFCSPHIGHO2_02_FULL_43_37]OHB06696.1 MAG: hypothetical protein A2944_02500 [Candidatus Zambryskibacteria bacterium RIFCSPLOWO2_01_FULL_52_12]OHB11028.1 MAG: hypothetical protein A3J09_00410 [Candidatus Zambryskibacteria bacterium RIFCSPLOWO2_02_FULL_51_21]